MRDILLKYRNFTITTPREANREIAFTEDFSDPEFDSWEIALYKNVPTLHLKSGSLVVKFQYERGVFEGRDPRGGFSIMRPPSNAITDLTEWQKGPQRITPAMSGSPKLTINKNSETAIMGGYQHEEFDSYNLFGVELKDALDELFKAGYERVMVMNTGIANIGAIDLLGHLEPYLGEIVEKGEVGSVQIVSPNLEGDAGELSIETGDWRGFMIKRNIWHKIQKIVLDSRNNFEYNMTQAFHRHNLIRLSTTLSRVNNSTPQDSRRKNFKVNYETTQSN